MKLSRFVVPALLGFIGLSAVAQADTITETTDFGNTRATARSLNGLFSSASNLANDNVYGVGSPTVIINGSIGIGNDKDFFSFSGTVGQQYYFDIDGTNGVEGVLSLFDSSGVLVALGDEMTSPIDPGSITQRDPFLGVYTLKKTDTFYLAFTDYSNSPTAYYNNPNFSPRTQLFRPNTGEVGSGVADNGSYGNYAYDSNTTPNQDFFRNSSSAISNYTLNATLATPEPSTYAMMALGLVALCVLSAKRKKDGQAI
jgi:hypothetical protein